MTSKPMFVSTPGIDGPDAGVDAMLDVLGSRQRRHVLSALVDRHAPVALDDLVAAVAARGTETPGADAPDARRDGLRTRFHHVHLPKLDDVGLVEYDHDARTVEATARLRSVAARLSNDAE